ncbi:Ig-like domain-containing protein, partial [Algoriphagus ratkowskyi]
MNKLLTNLIKASLFSFFFIFCYDAFPSTYYFSSSFGDDSHSNIQAQNQNTPWRSIQKLNSVFSTLQPGDNIMFRNGDTFHGTLIINKSGSSGAPISFGSYGSGENPVLTGFREIKDWVSLGGNVYETYIPEVSSSVSTVMMNDVLQAMGRYPNDNASKSGYLTINSSSWGSLGSSDLQAPASMTGGEIVIRKNNWIIDRHEINWHGGNSVSYNTAGSSYSPAIGYGFFIQNHPATLDKHGEWYFNKATKKLMIYFQGNPSGANIKVSTVDRVINTQNSASHIVLKNLAIQGSNENLINLEKSSSFIIENCQLEYVGKFAINSVMTRNLNVSNSQITNAFNGGINLGWDNRATVVRNNTFRQIFSKPGMGQNSDSQGNGIFMSENSSDVIVEFNEFLECGSNAIYFNGNNINVKNNFIDTFNFVKDDGGGIYTFTGTANTTFSNRKITNNIIVNGIGAVDGTKRFSATDLPYVEGIYLDLFSNGIEIDQNTIGNVKSKGIFLNNARNVSITNNKIFNAGYSIFIARDHTNNLTRNITMKNNEFLNKDSNQLHIYVRSKDNTLGQIGTFENNVYSRPVNENNTIRLETPGKNGLINLQSWKDTYWLDRSSSNSPATYDSDKMEIDEFIRFEYNNSNSSKSVSLSGTYVDLKGKILSGSVELPAYSSVLLLKTEASTTPENAAPAVSITSPSTNSQFIQANNISITSDATDTDGTIAKVDFYNGTTLLGTDTSAPYSYDWNNLPIGNFSITAKATDNKGTATVSEPVVINVIEKANEAPKVTITAPSTNSQFIRANNISITSDATDTDGTITKVDFYNGTSLLGTDTSAPYSFDWNNLPIGNFSITVKATDNKGASTVSAPVVINVIEKANEAPKVNITAPSTNSQFIQANNISITSDATDTDGTIVKVDFYNGTSLLGTDTSAPYSFDWNNLPIGNFSITAKATDNKGTATVSEPVVINVIEKANEAPKVTITAPSTNSQFIQANNISITSDATDNDGTIAKVDFYNGTSLLGTDTTAPYSFDWNNLPIGNFSITAKATDNKGTATVSAPVVINVTEKANEAPKVTITAPSTNSQFIQGEKISITSAATDNDGTIVKVDFYNGTSLLGTDTTAPYSFDWNNLPIGNFSITAKATDNKGTATVSAAVVINVTEKANEAPKVTITAPSTNSQFIQGEKISITSAATDTDGTIAKVDFYNGTSLLGTDTTAPYSFDWTNLPIGNFSITAKATDNKGAATVSEVVNIKIGEKESRSPFGGKAATIPGTVEAENYDLGGQGVGYFDTDAGNIGRMYRTDDVDIEVAVEGGYSVSWIN